jgi:hypothetical protein
MEDVSVAVLRDLRVEETDEALKPAGVCGLALIAASACGRSWFFFFARFRFFTDFLLLPPWFDLGIGFPFACERVQS